MTPSSSAEIVVDRQPITLTIENASSNGVRPVTYSFDVATDSGFATRIGGKQPINPSGGLECRGHPVGASGLAQIYELVHQLRGDAGPRQVERARIAMAENGGGFIGLGEAAMAIHIMEKV